MSHCRNTLIRLASYCIFLACGNIVAQTTTIVNDSMGELHFRLSPSTGDWFAPVAGQAEAAHAMDDPGWNEREFSIAKGESLGLTCFKCKGFRFSEFGIRIAGVSTLNLGATYRFAGSLPVYAVHISGLTEPVQAIDVGRYGEEWQTFSLNRSTPHGCRAAVDQYDVPSGTLQVELKKTDGLWLVDGHVETSDTLWLRSGLGTTSVVCGNCTDVMVESVAGHHVEKRMEGGTVYQIEQHGERFAVSRDACRVPPPFSESCKDVDSPFGVLPSCARMGMSPGGSGAVYIVNAEATQLSFEISDGVSPMSSTTMLSREGHTFYCQPECTVQIKTGATVVARKVTAGNKYMIVLTPERVYDLRSVSE